MKKLKDEINEMIKTFDVYLLDEDVQRYIITNGVCFNFDSETDYRGINREFDCFKFARFLRFCKDWDIQLDVLDMLENPWNPDYMKIVHAFDKLDNMSKDKRKSKTR